jgi:DNA-binding transcriptional regulator YhcF (GntR family)
MIDPTSDTPAYLQLAAHFRDRIDSGALAAGDRLPSEPQIRLETGLCRNTIRGGMQVLRSEGLIVTEGPRGSFVRKRPRSWDLPLGPRDHARLRPPTSAERQEHDMPPIARMVDVYREDGRTEHYPAESVRILLLAPAS